MSKKHSHGCAVCKGPAQLLALWPPGGRPKPRPICVRCYGKEVRRGIWEVMVPLSDWPKEPS